MTWNAIVTAICLVLLLGAVWREFARANRRRVGWRITAVGLAVAALAAIALPVKYWQLQKHNAEHEVVLLTPGTAPDSVKNYEKSGIYTLDSALKKQFPAATLIHSTAQIVNDSSTNTIRILGGGLSIDQLEPLANQKLIFHPGKPTGGLIGINWMRDIPYGEPLLVQGTYINDEVSAIKLKLMSAGTVADSVNIPAGASIKFNLSHVPKVAGPQVFELAMMDVRNQIMGKEALPVRVNPTNPLSVLILTGAPSFEMKFLKNWLGGMGYKVAWRAGISKQKYSSFYVNSDQIALNVLTRKLLSRFDIVVVDENTLKNLNTTESGNLKQAVEQSGTGLIILADSAKVGGPNSFLSLIKTHAAIGADTLPAKIGFNAEGWSQMPLPAQKELLSPSANSQPLLVTNRSKVLAQAHRWGGGLVVISTIANSFNWELQGSHADYAALWSGLLNKAVQHNKAQPQISWAQPVPGSGSFNTINITWPGTVQTISINNIKINPQQLAYKPFMWQGSGYIKRSGWADINVNGLQQSPIYVYPQGSFSSIRQHNLTIQTQRVVQSRTPVNIVTKQIQHKALVTVPKIYFYILLLLCCTYLWAEGKLR